MSEARERGGSRLSAVGVGALELRAMQRHCEARERGGSRLSAVGVGALELRVHEVAR
ncbi:MAG: hypothetical protein ACRCYQ_16075 [Nocardioides sp.]